MFLSAGLAPGVEEMLRSALSGHPEILTAEKLAELFATFALLRKIAIAFGLLCMVGGWGASQKTAWGRWMAVAASVGNLPLIPFLTPLGIAGLFLFLPGEPKEDGAGQADPAAAETPEPVLHVLVMIVSLALVVYLSYGIRKFAVTLGLPMGDAGGVGLLWILAGQLVFTLLHEIGHLAAARVVGFQFHEINIGPITLTERPDGRWAFRFSYERILMAGGYLQAVPGTAKDLRMNFMFVIIAGPAASLFTAMIGFLTLVSLPGTPYAAYWHWAAFVAAICTADCIANLLPLGLTDGALLMHTALGTKRGKGILAGLEAAMLNDRVERNDGLIDPVELLEIRRRALEQLEKNSEASALELAAQRIEFAKAALCNGQADAAAEALEEAGNRLEKLKGVPAVLWFRYWVDMYETQTARRHFSSAAGARQRGLEYGDKLEHVTMDWESRVPIRLACAKLLMSEGNELAAALKMQETRAACPSRQTDTASAVELLAVEAECEWRLGRRESGSVLLEAAIEIAYHLPVGQKAVAIDLLSHTAVRMSAAGEYGFARPLFEAAVVWAETSKGGETSSTSYRTAWAKALYENGDLAESKEVLAPLDSAVPEFSADLETLRAQLLLAEDRPRDAVAVLNPLLSIPEEDPDERRLVVLARSRALRSWALFRSGILEEAVNDARIVCDVLMPLEHPDAAPALLTLAMAVETENADLAEAYLLESSRLICDSVLLSPQTKASRLADLARSVIQVDRKEWGKRFFDQANQVCNGQGRESFSAKAAVAEMRRTKSDLLEEVTSQN